MSRTARLILLGSTCLLMGAACDGLRLPARPAQSVRDTSYAAVAVAPAPPKPKPAPPLARAVKLDAALDTQRFEQIRRSLRHLVVAEETYYAETGSYTDDFSRMGFAPEADTQVRFLWLSRAGWAVSGTHPGMPGRDCVIYVGRGRPAPTTARGARATREGVPACDAPPPPPVRAPVTPTPAAAAPAPPAPPDTGSALNALGPVVQMRVDMRNLVRSQETFLGQQGIYSRRTEPFALQYLWHRGVTMTILGANDAGWSARATYVGRPGKSCVIWVGSVLPRPFTEAQKKVPEEPGTPVCDD